MIRQIIEELREEERRKPVIFIRKKDKKQLNLNGPSYAELAYVVTIYEPASKLDLKGKYSFRRVFFTQPPIDDHYGLWERKDNFRRSLTRPFGFEETLIHLFGICDTLEEANERLLAQAKKYADGQKEELSEMLSNLEIKVES